MVGKIESGKDSVQHLVQSAAVHVGRITVIITNAVADVVREVGDWASEGFEMVEASKRAKEDARAKEQPRDTDDRELFIDDER